MTTHLEIIGRLQWRFAKTMPEHPHEYVVRNEANYQTFVTLFAAVRADGVMGSYEGRRYRYLYPGDGWRYWITDIRIINRARLGEAGVPSAEPTE